MSDKEEQKGKSKENEQDLGCPEGLGPMSREPDFSVLMSEEETAGYLRLTRRTLQAWLDNDNYTSRQRQLHLPTAER